jgi:HK97 family phage major capsid protein
MTLLQQMNAKLARRKEIQASAEAEGRELNEAEAGELKTIAAACVDLKAQIEQEKQFDAMDAEFNTPQGRRTQPAPVGNQRGQGAQARDEQAAQMNGFASQGEFFAAVYQASRGNIDQRLTAAATNVVGNNGGEEGYSLPPAVRNQIFTLLEEDAGDMMSMVTSEVTGANSVSFLKDVSTPWQAAGINTHWDQGGTKFAPTPYNSLTAAQMNLNGLSVFVTVDEDLLDDAPRLGQRLMQMAPMAMRWTINEAIRTGDGVGKPKGYMNSAALITVAKESGQGAGTLTAENIAKMYTRMIASSIKNAHWEINPELLPQLMGLKDSAGNLLWTPLNSGYKEEPNGLLLGRPVIFNEHPEAAGSKGDIQFVDPKGYYLALRTTAAKYAESMHLYFDQGLKCFRWRLRLDGQAFLTAPINSAKGSLTKSHFVTLAARG